MAGRKGQLIYLYSVESGEVIFKGRPTEAARLLEISLATLYRWLEVGEDPTGRIFVVSKKRKDKIAELLKG